MAETTETAENTQVAEEVKTHDVEYADEEAKQTVSTAFESAILDEAGQGEPSEQSVCF